MFSRLCFLASIVCVAVGLSWSSSAHAYPWMIRHDYGNCSPCHTDPSGAGVLTPYGRAQSAILLSSRYGAPLDDPGPLPDFLFGVLPSSDVLLMQGWLRNAYIWSDSRGHLVDSRILQMVADLGVAIVWKQFRASAIVGYNNAGSAPQADLAWVTARSSAGNLVSRQHWAGVSLADDAVLLRAGRMNIPFGLRNIEHNAWVRSETRTDNNQHQQHGVAVAYSNDKMRGEVLAIAGNYQVNPDAYRERGYSAFAEYTAVTHLGAGVSSLIAHATADLLSLKETTRQAHGVFVRAAPWSQLVLLGEGDALVTTQTGSATRLGGVGFAQADVEPVPGVHGIATGEVLNHGAPGERTNYGAWLSAAWFPAPHVDARFDAIYRTALPGPATTTYLVQLDIYL